MGLGPRIRKKPIPDPACLSSCLQRVLTAWSEPNSSAGNSNLDRLRFNSLRGFAAAAPHRYLNTLITVLCQLWPETDYTIYKWIYPSVPNMLVLSSRTSLIFFEGIFSYVVLNEIYYTFFTYCSFKYWLVVASHRIIMLRLIKICMNKKKLLMPNK
jgi:hypothetical protein